MNKLTPASRWIKEQFEGGVSTETVRRWVENQLIPGNIIDGKTFVDADRAAVLLDTCTIIRPQQPEQKPTGSAVVAEIMQGAMTQ
jgi:hypothetical protein